jgi:hypothetical protein
MKTLRHFATALAMLVLAACNAASVTLTQDNLDKIQEGMSSAQVKSILGSPTDSKSEPIPVVGGTKLTYIYEHDGDRAVIVLKNDTVQSKEGHFSKE